MRHSIVLLLFPIAILFGSCPGEATIKKEVFDRIDIGMTKPEVKNILSAPFEIRYSVDSFELYFYRVKHGRGDNRTAKIQFDKQGFVSSFSAGLTS